jgi:hypothetical protein
MNEQNERLDRAVWIVLLGAWLGVWGAWFPHPATALRLNPIDLAEWTTFLRSSDLRLMPELVRLSVVLAMIALSVSAGSIHNPLLRWGSRLLALIPALLILPPYPFILQAWWSESYGLRFVVAALGIVGTAAALLLDQRPVQWRIMITGMLAITSAALAVWTFITLRIPFGQRYAESIMPGWGIVLFIAALLVVIGVSGIQASRSRTGLSLASAHASEK